MACTMQNLIKGHVNDSTQYLYKGKYMANRTSVDPKCPCLVDQDLPLSKEQLAVKEEK